MKKIASLLFLLFLASTGKASTPYFDSLNSVVQKLPAKKRIARIHAIPFDKMNSNLDGALRLYQIALKDAKALKNNVLTAESYRKLAIVKYYQGEYDLSLNYNLKAIDFLEKAGAKKEAANVYCTLGYQTKRRNLKNAFKYMREGISILEELDDHQSLSSAYNNFGVLHEMDGDLDSALHYYFLGLDIIQALNDSIGIPYSYNNIAGIYVIEEKYDEAIYYYDKAFDIRLKRNDLNGIAENYSYYGDLYFKQKNYTLAIENYTKALEISEKIKYTYLCQTTAAQIAICYEKLGQFEQAYTYDQLQQTYKDSILNTEMNQTIAQLEVQFETERKEKELAQKNAQIKQRNYILTGLITLFVILIIFGYTIYRQQRYRQLRLIEESKLKDSLAQERLKNELHEERLRISRDLHDNIGSQLTFITSSIDNLKYTLKEEEVKDKLTGLTDFTRSTITKLRDTIWAMNKGQITLEDFHGRIMNHLESARNVGEQIQFNSINRSENIIFSASQGINLFRIVQESINNAMKYSMASKIDLIIDQIEENIVITVQDNGIGFSPEEVQLGHGLKNMEYRSKEIGANFALYSTPNQGTKISVSISNFKK